MTHVTGRICRSMRPVFINRPVHPFANVGAMRALRALSTYIGKDTHRERTGTLTLHKITTQRTRKETLSNVENAEKPSSAIENTPPTAT